MEYLRTYAKIHLDNVGRNVDGVKAKIPDGTRVMAVIKANAYGHGATALAEYLKDKVDWFGVATLDEALELRAAGAEKDILVLGCLNECEFESAVKGNITVAIADLARAEKLSAVATSLGITAKVHIKVDTGMSRIGFQVTKESVSDVVRIKELPGIYLEGMFTHFAIADARDKSSALAQREKYDWFVEECRKANVEIPICHLNNSAATMEMDRHYDMVRMGIMLYGLYPSEEMDKSYKLYPAMEIISHISFIKPLEKGRGVSYGHTFVTKKDTLVATVQCGYADGYPRCLSGKSEVLVSGVRCPVLGRICMDQMMVDISAVPHAKVGDEVVLVGFDGEEHIPVEEVADAAHSFNYEFVCGVAPRVPRAYFEGENHTKTVKYLV